MRLKTIAAIALLALGGGVALAACGGEDGDTNATAPPGGTTTAGNEDTATAGDERRNPPEPDVETIVVRSGEPVGGVRELEYSAAEQVRFIVRSDVADEIHVHGYDVTEEIPAGRATSISFPAEIEGIFEVELHGSGEQIAELRVNP